MIPQQNPNNPWAGRSVHGGSGVPSGATDDQLYTYEDIEVGAFVYFRGRPAVVTEKGPNVYSSSDGRHIEVSYVDEKATKSPSTRIHERIVNKYLRNREKLWVDWNNRLTNEADT